MDGRVWLKHYPQGRIINEPKAPESESLAPSRAMVNEIETVILYRIGGAPGATITKTAYVAMADVILSLLLVKEEVSLIELVNHVDEVEIDFKANTKWLLLQVKQDLEQRGFVSSSFKNKTPYINLKRKTFLKSEFRKTLILLTNDNSRMSYFF